MSGNAGLNDSDGRAHNYAGATDPAHEAAGRSPDVAARQLFFCEHLFHHIDLQITLCQEAFKAGVFLLQFA